ncbi:hypothetical protein [Leifsonia sp. RAF41]|uniref:hypothetical protein n=1 Tax=Leifsonia sp. RAF41 TaxID=3233056 RepID=UPI003F9DF7A3
MSTHRIAPVPPSIARPHFWPPAAFWKSLGSHILIPLFLVGGMALAYLGAFHAPQPHDIPVAIVGEGPAAQVFAQTLNDKAPAELDVTTVKTAAEAKQLLTDQKLAAAYQADATHATIYVSTAASETQSSAAEKLFLPIAYQQHLPVTIDDVHPVPADDGTGQGLFFLMVALSVGGYSSAIALAAVTAKLAVGWRVAVSAATALVVAGVGAVVAGPLFHVLNGNEWSIWLLASLYTFGIITIGVGLHPFLGRWTTPALTLLFVMLNVTSCGGIFPQDLQPAFFAGLNTFWNGAAWLDASRALTYFPGQAFGFDGLRLALWATAGLGLIALGHLLTVRRRRAADDTVAATADEEAAVVAA